MKIYDCACGATLFFENVQCLSCEREIGFLPDRLLLSALEPDTSPETWRALATRATYRKCQNYARERVCNWLIPGGDTSPFCVACRLNETILDLSRPENRVTWAKLETAKRRLIYSLLALRLPIVGRAEAPEDGLGFAFLQSAATDGSAPVMTGHAGGLITINAAEADDVEREGVRERLHERYRTLLGHFRHEIGHYYWTKLVAASHWLEPFRALFGDEREDYAAALERHYAGGGAPAAEWQERHISLYASVHPWEDWAETWAHYLHIVDTIETAAAFGVKSSGKAKDRIDEHLFARADLRVAPREESTALAKMLRDWVWLTLATNSINRSMGMRDVYPFVLNASIVEKLQLVHSIVAEAGGGSTA